MVLPVTIILHFQTPMSTLGRKAGVFKIHMKYQGRNQLDQSYILQMSL